MRILVTGGTGFLGRHAALRLKKEGNEVVVLGRSRAIGEALQARGVRFIQADLENGKAIASACSDMDMVIHSGGLASPWGAYDKFYSANVLGTQNVIQGCVQHRVSRLIYLSTPSLYFNYRHRSMIRESEPIPKPVTAYAATKKMADELVAEAAKSGLKAVSLRPRAIFGPGDQAVLVRLIRAGEKGIIPLVGGGKSFLDLTYIDNVVDALLLCVTGPEKILGNIYNITNGEPITSGSLVTKLFSALGIKAKIRKMPFPIAYATAAVTEKFYEWKRPQEEPPLTRYGVGLMARTQTLDISRAKEELNYSPKISLDEGLVRFARWWKLKEEGLFSKDDLGVSLGIL